MAPSVLTAAMSPVSPLLVRDIAGSAAGVKNTFSSWDACMQKDYCKWPVIAAIIVGSLIVASILFCVARCLCCGMECCCAACSCINACCPSPRGSKTKYRDAAPAPMPHHGYQPTPAPFYAAPTAPQFATFDASKKSRVNADALPAMPGWDTATSKQVLDDSPEEVEMDKMGQHEESKPMLAHGANSQIGQQGYGQAIPYQDRMGQNGSTTGTGMYGNNVYGSQSSGMIGTAVSGGAMTARPGVGSAQGYRGQHPGMGQSMDTYGSAQAYGQSMVAGAYGHQQRSPSYGSQQRSQSYGHIQQTGSQSYGQNGSLQNVNTAYGGASQQYDNTEYGVAVPQNNTGYGQSRGPNYEQQRNYSSTSSVPTQAAYTERRPVPNQRQEYSSQSSISHAQSYHQTPNPPQAAYGRQQDYNRPSGGMPSAVTSNSPPQRAAGYPGQQTYQPYQSPPQNQGQYQTQNQWREV